MSGMGSLAYFRSGADDGDAIVLCDTDEQSQILRNCGWCTDVRIGLECTADQQAASSKGGNLQKCTSVHFSIFHDTSFSKSDAR